MSKTFAVLDTETTGFEEKDQVIEVAVVFVGPVRNLVWFSLVKPTVPIHPSAKGAHHITEKDLANAPTPKEVIRRAPIDLLKDSVVVGHNLAYDERLLRQTGLAELLPEKRICTWQCAKHIWP